MSLKPAVFCIALLAVLCCGADADSLANFITRKNDTLFDGERVFRFISFNVPNLHLLEDNFAFDSTNNWTLPTSFEIRDAFTSVRDAGGTVVRIYCLRIQKSNEPAFIPKHLTAWHILYEPAFRTLDTVIACANEYNIRLIIPFLEGPPWWGPKDQFARLRGRGYRFEHSEIKEDYRHLVEYLLNRRNSVTGVCYKDDKAVLCWETGNEMPTSLRWLSEMSAFIKSVDGNHLVMDGNYGVRAGALGDPNVDIVSNHLYKKSARCIDRDLHRIRGRKAYIIGEWGWTADKARDVISRTIDSRASGALAWSLRYHYRGGGFTWHKGEGLHWPGGFARSELRDEAEILDAVRRGAFTIRGLAIPPYRPPAAPVMLPINHPSTISWQGSAGAVTYAVERSESPDGPWRVVGDSIDETVTAYRPLFVDTSAAPGSTYYYRVIARGPGGASPPCAPMGPVVLDCRTLVDEFLPGKVITAGNRGTVFTDAQPWRFKYDFHRLLGGARDFIEYQVAGPISSVRIYAFFPKQATDFSLHLSTDGITYLPVSVRSTPFPYCCADPRDRLQLPVLFIADSPPPGCNRVRITFPGTGAQAGRCEIDYDAMNR